MRVASRRAAIVLVAAGSIAYACNVTPPAPAQIAMPTPGPPFVTGQLATDRAQVWGVADLHAHPAAQLAFGGLNGQSGLLWGDLGLPGGVLGAVHGGDLPDIPPCDPSTHERDVSDQVSRVTRDLVFSQLAVISHFPHTPHGGSASDGDTSYGSWPNARDVLHQAMNVQSLRRAYEGGMRLIFASTVESQVIAFAMHTTLFPTPFSPTREIERASAEAQLVAITNLVNANSDWMEIAVTPDQAEEAIRSNRLAVVLAIENDGLLLDDIRDLVSTYGVAAIVPVHLVDNDVGGTAAYDDIFNEASNLEGTMFGYPNRYISVEPDPSLRFHLGWPAALATMDGAYTIEPIDYDAAAPLDYTPYPACSPSALGVPTEEGDRNSVGLRQPQTIRALMAMGLIVDVAHMGFRTTEDTIGVAQGACNYPLVDTHTDFHLRDAGDSNERDLFEDHADYVATSGGVIGFGSVGRVTPAACARTTVDPSTIASARGGPLATFQGGQTSETVMIAMPPSGMACAPQLDPSLTSIGIQVAAAGPVPAGAHLYARIQFDEGHVQQTLLTTPSEITPIKLDTDVFGAQLSGANIDTIAIVILSPSTCNYGGQTLDFGAVTITGPDGALIATVSPGSLGSQVGTSPTTLGTLSSGSAITIQGRSSVTIFERCSDGATCDPQPGPPPENEPLEHLRVRIFSGTQPLKEASSILLGAHVTGSLCRKPDCTDAANPCTSPEFTMTPAGGWPAELEMDQYVAYDTGAGAEPAQVQAIWLCLDERDLQAEPWEIDEVDVDRVSDPVRFWAADYAYSLDRIFDGRAGGMGMGTDFNGVSPQFAFTDFEPGYAADALGCDGAPSDAGTAVYGDDASGGALTLQRPLRIGGASLCLPERGLAEYGMFPEFFATLYHYDPEAYRSLFSSAAATIAAWRAIKSAAAAMTTTPTTCGGPSVPLDDGGITDAGSDGPVVDAGSDALVVDAETGR